MKRYGMIAVVCLAAGAGIGVASQADRSQQEGTVLKAPVRIVNQDGKAVLEITDKGNLTIYSPIGKPLAGIGPNMGQYLGTVFCESARGTIRLGDR